MTSIECQPDCIKLMSTAMWSFDLWTWFEVFYISVWSTHLLLDRKTHSAQLGKRICGLNYKLISTSSNRATGQLLFDLEDALHLNWAIVGQCGKPNCAPGTHTFFWAKHLKKCVLYKFIRFLSVAKLTQIFICGKIDKNLHHEIGEAVDDGDALGAFYRLRVCVDHSKCLHNPLYPGGGLQRVIQDNPMPKWNWNYQWYQTQA